MTSLKQNKRVAIIGAGPAGLMAADYLSGKGFEVTVFERMPTVARKFLMAGKTGLNLTHNEPYELFKQRFYDRSKILESSLDGFRPEQVKQWADDLGAETFVGSSGRVFPKAMKASPLLRAWIGKLEKQGVTIKTRHQWNGFASKGVLISSAGEDFTFEADAYLFALGGASWPKLGSDAGWVQYFENKEIAVEMFEPANCGFDVSWSDYLKRHFAGSAVRSVTVTSDAGTIQGEFVISDYGVEGSLIYAHSAALRDTLKYKGEASLKLDLAPDIKIEQLEARILSLNSKASISTILRKAARLSPVKIALVHEIHPNLHKSDLARLIKSLEIPLVKARAVDEVISSAGGISFREIDASMMLNRMPGFFVAGEMLDWEAPTGGYLLTACFATGLHAAKGIELWLG